MTHSHLRKIMLQAHQECKACRTKIRELNANYNPEVADLEQYKWKLIDMNLQLIKAIHEFRMAYKELYPY
jgi:hypothetical protein